MHKRLALLLTVPTALLLPAKAAEEDNGAKEAASGGLPQLQVETYPSQIFWLLITFGILYFVCARVFLPRIGGVIEERTNRIADDLDTAADAKREAEVAEAAYLQSLADAKARAVQIAAETKASLDKEVAEMEAETNERLESDIEAAEKRIIETAAKAQEGIRQAAHDTTKELVRALIDETPSDDAVEAALLSLNSKAA